MGNTVTTAERNKALMHRIIEAVGNGDASAFYDHLAEDAVITITGENSWSQSFRGKQRIREDFYGYLRTRIAQRNRADILLVLADGDWVVVESRGNMVTTSGEPYRNHYCLLYRMRDGMIVEMKEYMDSILAERLLGPYPAEMRARQAAPAGA